MDLTYKRGGCKDCQRCFLRENEGQQHSKLNLSLLKICDNEKGENMFMHKGEVGDSMEELSLRGTVGPD